MDHNYYIPNIEDLELGLEVEVKIGFEIKKGFGGRIAMIPFADGEFQNIIITIENFKEIVNLLKADCLRVKYINKEDIESLGFELIEDNTEKEEMELYQRKIYRGRFNNMYYKIQITPIRRCIVSISSNNKDLDPKLHDHPDRLRFEGIIKNKSELKRILKQIGYEQSV